ncbi:MAG: hypothetical protein ACOYB2_09850, partial [Limnohabitans sp.]
RECQGCYAKDQFHKCTKKITENRHVQSVKFVIPLIFHILTINNPNYSKRTTSLFILAQALEVEPWTLLVPI